MSKYLKKFLILSSLFVVVAFTGYSQTTLPYEFVNNSPHFTDDEIYIGLIGQTQSMGPVWVDFVANDINNPQLHSINSSGNTLHKTAGDGGYGNFFTKLSQIKNKTVHLPKIFGCRLYIAFKSPLFIKFYDNGGFAGPSLAAGVADPSAGIRWELVELTWADNGAWVNTSRVDAFQYPMGLELWGTPNSNNSYMKTGELISHSAIIQKWQSTFADGDFKPCLKNSVITYDQVGGMIEQPSKISEFGDAGASKNYFQPYIDQIWNHFINNEFVANCGDRGIYRGQINKAGELMMRNDKGGAIAKIYGKPNTQEVIEGKGRIAEGNTEDLAFQAQFCGALNRGVIDITATNGKLQNWGDTSTYFTQNTYNKYVWFFHQPDVSYDKKCYAFAYDDTWDQSATLVTSIPSKVKITIGGFFNQTNGPLASIVVKPNTASIKSGDTQKFTATGYDANMNVVSISPSWSCTTGGSIDASGNFSSTTAKNYVITASVGEISGTATVTVTSGGGSTTNCTIANSSGHFATEVSVDKSNPTLTFIPSGAGIGSPTLLMFYKVSQTTPSGSDWNQVPANNLTPNTPFRITANEGDKVYFYYVYSHPSGQQNSLATVDTYIVGTCSATALNNPKHTNSIVVYPNPVTNILNVNFDKSKYAHINLLDVTGKTVYESNISPDQTQMQIDVEKLSHGVYSLILRGSKNVDFVKIMRN